MENREESTTDSLYEDHFIQVDPGQSELRIDKYVFDKLEKVSRNRIQNAIRAGAITVNEKEVKPNYKVKPNDSIKILLPKPSGEFKVIPEDIPLDIRYEDDDVMVVYKPNGLVVHPGHGNPSGTLVNALAYYFKQDDLPVMEGNSADRPGIVHRIDKDTSGLMVIAKNEFAISHLGKQFYNHSIERKYQAIVWGNFDDASGTIDMNIGRHLKDRTKQDVFPDGDYGKRSITHYKVLEDLYYISLIECQLETGRTHQIRVHMSALRHPLFSDVKYGGDKIIKGTVFSKYKHFVQNVFKMIPRHALHAKSLAFVHPKTNEKMYFESELPEDMQNALNKWRNYIETKTKND